ncbi:3-oxo-5-alpha-steroid 4-dehydrogenase [Conoideocrella luteorostrata]|uniref:Polyprenal reductase n=1 Tax=Conoideocrella luteorostrata TaxID=1105319 RepID=A0AAJ0CJU4_9HYPO|nr:3-oxo-5-alpha-steroid 4-dehydrogenase [Conoideocrella luteorostrata]
MDALVALVSGTPPSAFCQTFFLISAAAVLSLNLLPKDARGTVMDYGARRPDAAQKSDANGRQQTSLASILDQVTSYGQIPHSWFWHFYCLSTTLSAFWAWQYLEQGSVIASMVERQASMSQGPSVELGRVALAWAMMASQGSRRLFECFFVSKPGKTPMWFVHWALALLFYTAMSVAIWVEGCGAIRESWQSPRTAMLLTPGVLLTLAVFIATWLKQNECHRYLASLKKYTLPNEGMFKYIICPHYTCECVLYLAISFMAAPPGSIFNKTLLCGLAFVVVNLGATAFGTKQWYAEKFGIEGVVGKWRMIPGIF